MFDISKILMVITFIIIFGLFFASTRVKEIFIEFKDQAALFNTNFLATIDERAAIYISILIFFLVFVFVISYFNK